MDKVEEKYLGSSVDGPADIFDQIIETPIKLAFFGASVTAQKEGYVDIFQALDVIQKFEITKYAYGSLHIRDAGICFIDDVLSGNPNYCFIDWFSTGYIPSESELIVYLDTFRDKFINNSCQIIFLFLSGSEEHMSDKRINMYNLAINYAKKYNIPYIDLRKRVKDLPTKDLYRDTVHTLEFGSKIYGEFIYQTFLEKILPFNNLNFSDISKTKYSNIQKIPIDSETIYEEISIIGSAEIIGLFQNIGPYSGKIELIVDDTEKSIQDLWDCWCYYEREVLKITKEFKSKLVIKISQEDFNRSSAKEQVDWTVTKVIKPCGFLYFIGTISKIQYQ
jgi:hypothetical protein